MWTTALQIGQLVDTAQKVFDATETRILISHASPGREGILAQLALTLKVHFTKKKAVSLLEGRIPCNFRICVPT